jgi:hypothetical protein
MAKKGDGDLEMGMVCTKGERTLLWVVWDPTFAGAPGWERIENSKER